MISRIWHLLALATVLLPALSAVNAQSTAGETESESPDEIQLFQQVQQLTGAIVTAYQTAEFNKVADLTDELERLFNDNNLWRHFDAEQKQVMRRNFAIWRADAARERGQYASAETQYDLALAAFTDAQKGSREYATTIGKQALVLRALGKYERAYELFLVAQQRGEAIYGSQSMDNATALGNIGLILQSLGRYDEATQYFARAVPIYEQTVGENHPFTGLSYSNWALNFASLGQYDESERLFRKALRSYDNAGLPENHQYLAAARGGLGVTLMNLGRYQEGEVQARQSLSNWNNSKGPDHAETILAVSNLGAILVAQNRLEEAVGYFEQALASARERFGDSHLHSVRFASNLGGTQYRLGQFAEAEENLRYALKWGRIALGEDNSELGVIYNNLASVLGESNTREAVSFTREGIRIMRGSVGDEHPGLVEAYVNLGVLQMRLGDEGAENSLREALRRARNLPGRPGGPILYSINALTLYLGPQDATSEEALALSREAVAITRQRRADRSRLAPTSDNRMTLPPPINRELRGENSDEASFGFHMKVLAARAKALPEEESTLVPEMFVAAQDATLSASARAMAQTAARTASGDGELARLVREQQDQMRKLVLLDRNLQKALVAGKRTETGRLQEEILAGSRRLANTNEQLATGFPDYADLVSPDALDVADVQRRLGPEDGLLLIFPSIGDVFVLALTRDDISWSRRTQQQEQLGKLIVRLRCQLDPASCDEDFFAGEPLSDAELEGYRAFDRAAAFELYQQLVAPVEDILAGKSHLFVVSSGRFSSLPLAALLHEAPEAGDDADPDTLARSKWLADRYAFTALPAVSALKAVDAAGDPRAGFSEGSGDWRFTGFGAPSFVGPPAGSRGRARTGASGFFRSSGLGEGLSLADPASLKQLDPLPGTERELRAMAAALGASASSIVIGDDATEPAVRNHPQLSTSQVLVFATHGLLPQELAGLDEPALVFTPPESASLLDDGVLTASEAVDLKLDARWVILSACNTASTSGAGSGDSLSGLSRAFLYAGARSLLASHWRVGDAETALLTVEAIKADRNVPEMGRARALQQAMQIVRTGKYPDGTPVDEWQAGWVHPASWAPFVHISNRP